VGRYQKGKPIWILLKQETVSGSGISPVKMQMKYTTLQLQEVMFVTPTAAVIVFSLLRNRILSGFIASTYSFYFQPSEAIICDHSGVLKLCCRCTQHGYYVGKSRRIH